MDEQHCPACWTEYVAGVPRCAHCGGALVPGALPERRPEAPAADLIPTGSEPVEWLTRDPPDTLLATLPGETAEVLARLLTSEGIPCLLECRGIRRIRRPGELPAEPIAVTLPVEVSVPTAVLAQARDLLESLGEDVIGDQWASEGVTGSDAAPSAGMADRPPVSPQSEIRPEGSGLSWLLAALAAAAVAAALGWLGS